MATVQDINTALRDRNERDKALVHEAVDLLIEAVRFSNDERVAQLKSSLLGCIDVFMDDSINFQIKLMDSIKHHVET